MTTPAAKRTTSPAFQFYPKEFLSSSKVIAMSMTERGVYITLLSLQWLDGSLPIDLGALSRLVGVPQKQFLRMWPHNLERCFVVKGGRYVNPRLERVRIEQVEYRKRQAEHGAKGGRPPKKGEPFNPERVDKALLPASVSASSSSEERTHRQGGAPLHTSHKNHAACGRVCVPSSLHDHFVRSRNHLNADSELRTWYARVDEEWTTGAKRDASPGGNDYDFWRARFNEEWPPTPVAKPSHPWPNWKPRAGVRR